MRTIYRENNWRIVINGREHGEPHFHIKFSDNTDCSISISRLAVIVGKVFPKQIHGALAWAEQNKDKLLKTWKEMNP